ncbi:Alpha/Beta hydrolase protein [Hygrophoropsis aurantiaca]|uniref:Alpha/Beta hydrolase protein n=1 Tax=Hygrophoropsis aurantiaca TaxID=72124 RepID=A0ACB7ZXB3_9AGAM|nr:Alpha/Beta hydrolase protein [Hygrophoropsis aurantiaca]
MLAPITQLTILCTLLFRASNAISPAFNPRSYHLQTINCKGFNRASRQEVPISIDYVDINPGTNSTILMVHGWPSLWSTWGYQIQELKDDYRLIVPDIRGFGGSTSPGDVQSSGTLGDMVGDLVCILEYAKVDHVVCLGHDWGAEVCYEAARRRPDVFTSVVGITVPYFHAAGPFIDSAQLAMYMPRLAYQVFFETRTSAAIAELNKDIRRTLRGTLRTVSSPPPDGFLTSKETFIGAWDGVFEIPAIPFFTEDEEDYFVERISIQGFNDTLIFYTHGNRYGTWQATHIQGNHTIPQPVLSILPLDDPVADWVFAANFLKSAEFLPQLTTKTMPGAHWPHLEHPDVLNSILRDWLSGLQVQTCDSGNIGGTRAFSDEL